MPTFQTIRIHPDLHARLVTESSVLDDNGHATLSFIETPQALLSRNPTSIRLYDPVLLKAQPLPVDQVNKLRLQVAHAWISHSAAGRHCRVVQESAAKRQRLEPLNQAAVNTRNVSIMGTTTALELLQYDKRLRQQHPFSLSTGCPTLDSMLSIAPEHQSISTQLDNTVVASDAGIPFGYVTQFSGPPGVGKTQLALGLAAALQQQSSSSRQHQQATCWYLSSCPAVRSFALRLKTLVADSEIANQDIVLNHTTFVHVSNEYCLLDQLAQLEEVLIQGHSEKETTAPLCLLVIDSISSCLTADYSNAIIMEQIAFTIKRLARTFRIAIVVCNGVVQNRQFRQEEDSEDEHTSAPPHHSKNSPRSTQPYKPALGRPWRSVADISVWLDRWDKKSGVVHATLERHPTKVASGNVTSFCITNAGAKEIT
jgi:RecA/RadA recombinase